MSDITITQVKEEKRKLEKAVAQALLEFSDRTGVTVDSLRIIDAAYIQQKSTPVKYIIGIEMTL